MFSPGNGISHKPNDKPANIPSAAGNDKPLTSLENEIDYDKLALCVSKHETSGCTKGSAKYNNCVGIKRNGRFVRYKTKEASLEDFKSLWKRAYGGLPTLAKAQRYSGSDRPYDWYHNVTTCYYK